MQYINRLSDYEGRRESAVTFGKFDGRHTGHQKLVEQVQRLGEAKGLASIVCAFDMQPLWERIGKTPRMLMTGTRAGRPVYRYIVSHLFVLLLTYRLIIS